MTLRDTRFRADYPIGVPQFGQNLCGPSSFSPQFAHARCAGAPQFGQNFVFAGMDSPQPAHVIVAVPPADGAAAGPAAG